jgi:hypothetical protein
MRTRSQIFPWVPPALRKRLRTYAARKGVTESAVVQAALQEHLDSEATDRALILRRLDRAGRAMATFHRDFELLSQAFAVYVQLWFAHTPRVTPDARAAAEQGASRRYRQFLDYVSKQFGEGDRFIRDVLPPEEEPDTEVREPAKEGDGDDRAG